MLKDLAQLLDTTSFAEPWLPQAVVVLVTTLLVSVGARYLLRRAERLTRRTTSIWDDALFHAMHRPMTYLIWLVGLALVAELAGKGTGLALFDYLPSVRNLGVVACLSWFLIRLVANVADNVVARAETRGEEVDRTTIDALSKLARLVVVLVAVLTIMQTLGFSLSGLLAAGGIGGLAIGFAAKDLLANFFGGLTIYLDRPFSVGDWIRSPDKDIEGTVEYISWRHTRIRRFNKNPLYVPNAFFTTIAVENPSRMSNRRIKETIGIRYADIGRMAAITADVKAMLRQHPEIDTGQTLIVNFNTFGPSSLDFFIYTFTKTKEWVRYHEVKEDILLRVAEIIARHGAAIAFPTHTVHLEPAPVREGTS